MTGSLPVPLYALGVGVGWVERSETHHALCAVTRLRRQDKSPSVSRNIPRRRRVSGSNLMGSTGNGIPGRSIWAVKSRALRSVRARVIRRGYDGFRYALPILLATGYWLLATGYWLLAERDRWLSLADMTWAAAAAAFAPSAARALHTAKASRARTSDARRAAQKCSGKARITTTCYKRNGPSKTNGDW